MQRMMGLVRRCIEDYRMIEYGEWMVLAVFLLTAAVSAGIGFALRAIKPRSKVFYMREGFTATALSWIVISVVGAAPFVLTGCIPNPVDALFETVSGFTTTGASILPEVESLPKGILFWRSFTHWIGGMGILVFVLAVLPAVEERSIHIMRAEVPGPQVSKLVPRTRNTAAILYCIYLAMTVLLILLLVLGDMPLFDAAVHAFGAAGTGGFSIKNTSIGWYDSAYVDVVIGIFMILFSMNFNLYFFLLLGQVRDFFKNEELRWYLCIIAAAVLLIAWNISSVYGSKSLLYSFFQVSSIISTTGYATTDFSLWPEFSRCMLLFVMFIGGCAGGTGGGIKVSRAIILVKSAGKEIHRLLHPRSIRRVTMDQKPVSDSVVHGTMVFFSLYVGIIMISVLLLALDNMDFASTFSSVLACISNIGPGLNVVGPMGNYGSFSVLSKLVLTLDMLLGRLEIFPLLTLFTLLPKKK